MERWGVGGGGAEQGWGWRRGIKERLINCTACLIVNDSRDRWRGMRVGSEGLGFGGVLHFRIVSFLDVDNVYNQVSIYILFKFLRRCTKGM